MSQENNSNNNENCIEREVGKCDSKRILLLLYRISRGIMNVQASGYNSGQK